MELNTIKKAVVIIGLLFVQVYSLHSQSFKATYHITLQSDSTNLSSKKQERAFLFIENNEKSYYGTENFLKSDSVMRLIMSGKASSYEEISSRRSNPRYTKFDQFIQKNLQKNTIVYEEINADTYKYFSSKLSWFISDTTAKINGYECNKATTHFAGRDYEAWFTKDIPISDGPYIFCGLPGLIVKINDVKSYYTFELIGFETFTGEFVRTIAKAPEKIILTSREKVFEIREESRKDPIGSLDKSFGLESLMTPEMKQLAKKKIAANNNPLELRVD